MYLNIYVYIKDILQCLGLELYVIFYSTISRKRYLGDPTVEGELCVILHVIDEHFSQFTLALFG